MEGKHDQGRKWFGTLNNPEEPDGVETWLKHLYETAKPVYVCGQLERGDNGTPHI